MINSTILGIVFYHAARIMRLSMLYSKYQCDCVLACCPSQRDWLVYTRYNKDEILHTLCNTVRDILFCEEVTLCVKEIGVEIYIPKSANNLSKRSECTVWILKFVIFVESFRASFYLSFSISRFTNMPAARLKIWSDLDPQKHLGMIPSHLCIAWNHWNAVYHERVLASRFLHLTVYRRAKIRNLFSIIFSTALSFVKTCYRALLGMAYDQLC